MSKNIVDRKITPWPLWVVSLSRCVAAIGLRCVVLLVAAQSSAFGADNAAPLLGQLQNVVDETRLTGVGIALVDGDAIVFAGGMGNADQAAVRKVDAHTVFRLGSVSKMFVAVAVMQLVEQGKLDLDAEVADMAPELAIDNPWRDTQAVRVVHLLEHTAGLDDVRFANFAGTELPLDTLLHRLERELVVRWPPGERYSYSNVGYVVAAYLVQKASGESFADYLQHHIFTPLDMQDTRFLNTASAPSLATGHRSDGGVEPGVPFLAYPAGGLVSSSSDMARFLRFYTSHAQVPAGILSPAAIFRMERPRSTLAATKGIEYGYGLGNELRQRGDSALFGHDGSVPGFTAALRYDPETKRGFVLLQNSDDGAALERVAQLATHWVQQPRAASPAPPAQDMQAWIAAQGYYVSASPRLEIMRGLDRVLDAWTLSVEDGRVRLSHPLGLGVVDYLPSPEGLLRKEGERWPSVVLARDAMDREVIAGADRFLVRGSWFAVVLPIYLLAAALVLLLVTLVATPFWLLRYLRGEAGQVCTRARAWVALATLALTAAMVSVLTMDLRHLLDANWHSVVFAGAPVAGAVMAVMGCVESVRACRAAPHSWQTWHALTGALAAVGLCAWLFEANWLGLRVWAW